MFICISLGSRSRVQLGPNPGPGPGPTLMNPSIKPAAAETLDQDWWRQVSRGGFDLSNMYSISSLTTREPLTKVRAQRQRAPWEMSRGECVPAPPRTSPPPSSVGECSSIRELRLTLVTSPGITRHYLFLPHGGPKARLIVSLIHLRTEGQLFCL